MLQVACSLGPNYKPPTRELISGKYLDAIHETSRQQQMTSLLLEGRIFGVTVFGDGATIRSVALVNFLAAGVNNPFALLTLRTVPAILQLEGRKMHNTLPIL